MSKQEKVICQGCWAVLGKVYVTCPDCGAALHRGCADKVDGVLCCVGCAKLRRK